MCCCFLQRLIVAIFISLAPTVVVTVIGEYAICISHIHSLLSLCSVRTDAEKNTDWFAELVKPNWSIPESGFIMTSAVVMGTATIAAFLIYLSSSDSLYRSWTKAVALMFYG